MQDMSDLLDELDSSREQFLVAIEPLSDEGLSAPGAVGEWSVADVLVNLTVWEAELVTAMMRWQQGKKPTKLLAALSNPEKFDRERWAENRGRDLDRVFDDWQHVRLQLETWLEDFSVRDLKKPGRFKGLGKRPLYNVIKAVTVDREQRYLEAVRDFARTWAEAEEASSQSVIPLSTISSREFEDDDDNQSD